MLRGRDPRLTLVTLALTLSLQLPTAARGEGSAETDANQGLDANTLLRVDIQYDATEMFVWTGDGSVTVTGPSPSNIFVGIYNSGDVITPLTGITGAYRVNPDTDQTDTDGDDVGDACDDDKDNDGVDGPLDCDDLDDTVSEEQTYYLSIDTDKYGDPNDATTLCSSTPPAGYVVDDTDNCPGTVNPDQADFDGDGEGEGDACEALWYSGPPPADCGCTSQPSGPDAGLLLGLTLLGLMGLMLIRCRRIG